MCEKFTPELKENVIRKVQFAGEPLYIVDKMDYSAIAQYLIRICENSSLEENPFYIFDVGDIIRKYELWNRKFPNIKPFYAIKCHPHPVITKLLALLGVNFDCASLGEIKQILGHGVAPERIIFANPQKFPEHLKYASEEKVLKMTFDCVEEMKKIKKYCPEAHLVLRMFVETSKARCPVIFSLFFHQMKLGLKFGARIERLPEIINTAKELNLKLIGVSFHVGSGCFDSQAYKDSLNTAKSVVDYAISQGIHLNVVDIGGGFPGDFEYEESRKLFDECCETINGFIKEHFKDYENLNIIAEPGRFFVASSMQLVCQVLGEAINCFSEQRRFQSYFLNDSIHGSLNCIIFDHYIGESYIIPKRTPPISDQEIIMVPKNITNTVPVEGDVEMLITSFYGPTGLPTDVIMEQNWYPKVSVGDLIVYKNMGAYTRSACSNQSGISTPATYNFITQSDFDRLLPYISKDEILFS